MARTTVARIGMAMAATVGLLTFIVMTPSPASACSFITGTVQITGGAAAGGSLQVHGSGFFTVEGEVGADCSGDYLFVPQPPVTVTVRFETHSGPQVVAVEAPVSGEPTPADEASPDDFTFDVDVPIPADATSATVEAGFSQIVVLISGASTTTTTSTAPPVVPEPQPQSQAEPAAPVSGDPTFTG